MKASNTFSFKNVFAKGLTMGALSTLPIFYSQAIAGESNDFVQIIEPQSKSQLWVNAGMVSHHFQQDKNFNNGNWGAGLEYRFNTVASLTAGRFYNSDRDYSNYAGVYYQPIAIGPIKVGAVVSTATPPPIMAAGLQRHYLR